MNSSMYGIRVKQISVMFSFTSLCQLQQWYFSNIQRHCYECHRTQIWLGCTMP